MRNSPTSVGSRAADTRSTVKACLAQGQSSVASSFNLRAPLNVFRKPADADAVRHALRGSVRGGSVLYRFGGCLRLYERRRGRDKTAARGGRRGASAAPG